MKIFNIIAILTLALLTNLATAHSGLKDSMPGNGAVLTHLPEELILEFTTPVKLVRVQLIAQSGEPLKLLSKPSKNFATTFTIASPMLATGNYKVKWIAMGKDAHKMKGNFTFTLHAPEIKKMSGSLDKHNNQA